MSTSTPNRQDRSARSGHTLVPRTLTGLSVALALATSAFAGDRAASAGPQPAPAGAVTTAWGDFDGDAFADALVLTSDGAVSLLQNLGDGSFVDVTDVAGLSGLPRASHVLFEDVDGDGLGDAFLGRLDGGALLLTNRGQRFAQAGPATELPVSGAVLSAHTVDYDADGRQDLHVVTDEQNVLLHGLGREAFEAIVLSSVGGERLGRIDGAGSQGFDGVGGVDSFGGGAADEGDDMSAVSGGPGGVRGGPPPLSGGPLAAGAAQPLVATGDFLDVRPGGPGTGARDDVGMGQSGTLCMNSIVDAAGSGCLQASSTPTLGMLYPLSADLFVDGNGRVGIGTVSPHAELHVEGSGWFGEDDGGLGAGAGKGVRAFYNSVGAVGSVFAYDYDLGQSEDLVLQGPGGLVGIGTNAPTNALHIVESAGVEGLRITETASTAASHLYLENFERTWSLASDASPDVLRIQNDLGSHLVIDGATGDVGLGTSSPNASLHVSDASDAAARISGGHANLMVDRESSSVEGLVQFETAGTDEWVIGTGGGRLPAGREPLRELGADAAARRPAAAG